VRTTFIISLTLIVAVTLTLALAVALALTLTLTFTHTLTSLLFSPSAVKLEPGLMQGHEMMGMALAEAGRSQEAVAALSAALKLDPRNPNVLTKLQVITQTHVQCIHVHIIHARRLTITLTLHLPLTLNPTIPVGPHSPV
jgi:serine/threonine-protein kinase ATR